jgi:CDP-glucose 4,6-dehydratase
MEELVSMFGNVYENKRVLVTGHTGFKGSWLVLWLQMMGAKVTGISLPPETTPNHWSLLNLNINSYYIDIRDQHKLQKKIIEIDPEIIFHLAAQPLVRKSYKFPLDTWATNVMGTANLLEACRSLDKLSAVVIITTDKCYENKEQKEGYKETDQLGGYDPYSASKAGSELVASSYRRSFFGNSSGALIASARAGNVIGGGDWSEDRLIPDLFRAMEENHDLEIRSPKSTRPWQHILECLSGYLALGQKLSDGNKDFADSWNFGPGLDGNKSVLDLLEEIKKELPNIKWKLRDMLHPHEANLLYLNSEKARDRLDWKPVWSFEESVKNTSNWYKNWFDHKEVVSLLQLETYIKDAKNKSLKWTE